MLFILLAIVFLLAYGVAAQSLLYPNAEPSWNILYNVVYHPYLSMYQEFPLDELEGKQSSVELEWYGPGVMLLAQRAALFCNESSRFVWLELQNVAVVQPIM